jgi:hypothetical protein
MGGAAMASQATDADRRRKAMKATTPGLWLLALLGVVGLGVCLLPTLFGRQTVDYVTRRTVIAKGPGGRPTVVHVHLGQPGWEMIYFDSNNDGIVDIQFNSRGPDGPSTWMMDTEHTGQFDRAIEFHDGRTVESKLQPTVSALRMAYFTEAAEPKQPGS